jgi:DNA-binding transcriptional LysR family regulator
MHFGRAAGALYVSVSAVSRAIKDLEQELGTPLFVRQHRQLELTVAGSLLVGQATATLAGLDRVRADIAALVRSESRTVRVGAPQHVPPALLDIVVDAVEHICRANVVGLELQPHLGVESELRAARLDLAVGYLPVDDEGIGSVAVTTCPFHVALRSDDPLACRERLELAELRERTVVAVTEELRPLASQRLHQTLVAAGITRFSLLPTPDPLQRATHVRRTGDVAFTLPLSTGGNAKLFDDAAFAVLPLRNGPAAVAGLLWRRGVPGNSMLNDSIGAIRDATIASIPASSPLTPIADAVLTRLDADDQL